MLVRRHKGERGVDEGAELLRKRCDVARNMKSICPILTIANRVFVVRFGRQSGHRLLRIA